MEFISKEQFQEQPKDIQMVFLEWWKNNTSKGDLLINLNDEDVIICVKEVIDNMIITFEDKSYEGLDYFDAIPLFVEGQLREFIEDRLEQIYYENDGSKIELDITHNNNFTRIEEGLSNWDKGFKRVEWVIEDELGKKYNLLQVYWKVACMVATKEVIIND